VSVCVCVHVCVCMCVCVCVLVCVHVRVRVRVCVWVGDDVSVVYCKRKRNILWNVRVFRGIIKALKQQPRPI